MLNIYLHTEFECHIHRENVIMWVLW